MGPGNRSTSVVLLITTLILSAAIGLAIPLASGSQPGAEVPVWTPPLATSTSTRTPIIPSPTVDSLRTRARAGSTPTWTVPFPGATATLAWTNTPTLEKDLVTPTPLVAATPLMPESLPTISVPEAAITPGATPSARILAERLNLRAGPGRDYPVSAVGMQGQEFAIVARNVEGNWLQVCCVEGIPLWLAADYVEVIGSLDDVPVGP